MLHGLPADGGNTGQAVPFLCGNNHFLQAAHVYRQIVDALLLGRYLYGLVADIRYSDGLAEAFREYETAVLVGYGNYLLRANCHDRRTDDGLVRAAFQHLAAHLCLQLTEKQACEECQQESFHLMLNVF